MAPMRTAIVLGVALLAVLLGGWGTARYDLTDRVSQVATGAKRLCRAPRGSAPITEELLETRLLELADGQRLHASDIRIESSELTGDSPGLAGQVAGQLSKLTKGKLQMTSTEIEVSARLQGKQWLWSVDREIHSSCILRGKITRTGG